LKKAGAGVGGNSHRIKAIVCQIAEPWQRIGWKKDSRFRDVFELC
jgi:hypothetical protein